MSINVVYFSKTGHSKKLAEVIAQELSVLSQDLQETPTPQTSDLLFLVTGIYASKSAPEVLRLIDSLDPKIVPRVCLVTSSMGQTSPKTIRKLLEDKGVYVLPEEYRCKGSFLLFGKGHPTSQELTDAATFARQIATKTF